MRNDTRDLFNDSMPTLAWAIPADDPDAATSAAHWLSGGALLLLWTGLVFLLTSV